MSFKIDLKIFFFIIVFYFTKQIEIYSYMMFFALIHELGHLCAGVLLGFKPKSISLIPLGFSINFKISEGEYNKKVCKSTFVEFKKIIIALAGPLTNVIIIYLCIFLKMELFNLDFIIYSNYLIAFFNLLPIYPLDGGRILKSAFNISFGRKKAYTYSLYLSNIIMFILTFIASILVFYYKSIAIFLIIILLWGIVLKENKYVRMKINLYGNL